MAQTNDAKGQAAVMIAKPVQPLIVPLGRVEDMTGQGGPGRLQDGSTGAMNYKDSHRGAAE